MAHTHTGCRRFHQHGLLSHGDAAQGEGFGGPGAEAHYPPSLELEPRHLEIRMQLDLVAQTAAGEVTHRLVATRAGVRELTLQAVDFGALEVHDKGGRPLSFTYDGQEIVVTWRDAFAKGEERQLALSYRLEQPESGLFFMKPTPAEPQRPTYAVTDHETERARYWLPAIDHPSARMTLEFHLTASADYAILANGSLVEERKHPDGTKTAHWRLDHRCPTYLVCFAVGDFVRYDDGELDGVPFAYFTGREFKPDDLKRSFGRSREIMAWMVKRLQTKFPYPKYYQFAVPNFGGAMENISLVSWSDDFVLTERRAPEKSWVVDQVNVHEMAHSYFGDLVGARDFAHSWLKESWATYMETCWLEDRYGGDEQRYDLFRNARSYLKEADEHYSRPMVTRRYTSSWQLFDAHLYPGGACRLHTLRSELGDEVFWAAVSDYLHTYRESAVETDDFRKMLEKHSGKSLQKFFDQWFYAAGYPALKVSFSYEAEKQTGTFTVEQSQVDEKKGLAAFALETELGWTISGKDETMPVTIDRQKQSFTVRMETDPEQVRFDPNGRVLHKLDFNPGETKLKNQLQKARDVVGRIQAAYELAKTGKRANVMALLAAWREEKFWGVRRELIAAIESSRSEAAVEALAEILAKEEHPLVMDQAFAAAAEFRSERLQDVIQGRLEGGKLLPFATAAAYRTLGAMREKAPVGLLEAAAQRDHSAHGTERAAALHALGMTREEEPAMKLVAWAPYGKLPYRVRSGAVAGLGAAAPYLDKKPRRRIEEALIGLLRDPDQVLRLRAARALGAANAQGAVGALEAYGRSLPLQERVAVDTIVQGLRRGDDEKVRGLEKQIDELNEKYRKVLARLDELEEKGK